MGKIQYKPVPRPRGEPPEQMVEYSPFVKEDNRPDPIVYLALVVASFAVGVIIGLLLAGGVL